MLLEERERRREQEARVQPHAQRPVPALPVGWGVPAQPPIQQAPVHGWDFAIDRGYDDGDDEGDDDEEDNFVSAEDRNLTWMYDDGRFCLSNLNFVHT